MRWLVTADLHLNHPRSRGPAMDLIEQMNRTGGDGVLLVGDTASFDGDDLEQALQAFSIKGPRLFVPGNHELWSKKQAADVISLRLLSNRVREVGWWPLESEPFVSGDVAIAGSLGWYDYSFARSELNIDHDFYAAAAPPGAVTLIGAPAELLSRAADSREPGRSMVARWNDHRHARLPMSDATFCARHIDRLQRQLESLSQSKAVIVATHTIPFEALLPPATHTKLDFVHAYLGSRALGEMISRFDNIKTLVCGHSHVRARAKLGKIEAINIGSDYTAKRFLAIEV